MGKFSWFKKPPSLYKTYPEAERIKLPEVDYRGEPLIECLKKRRSHRKYEKAPLTIEEVSILFLCDSITLKEFEPAPRAAPSAGALYPIELYLVAFEIKELEKGIYHYAFRDHSLEFIRKGDFREQIYHASIYQDMVMEASALIVLTAIFGRILWKYGERGYRYIYMEAGHISQNLYLIATSLGLGTVAVGAFNDQEMNSIIGVDGKEESVLYFHPIGRISKS